MKLIKIAIVLVKLLIVIVRVYNPKISRSQYHNTRSCKTNKFYKREYLYSI